MNVKTKNRSFLKTSAIVLTFAVLFQFLLFGIYKDNDKYIRPVDAKAFTLTKKDGIYYINSYNDLESFSEIGRASCRERV